MLEKILDSPLDCKEVKPVNPKGNQSWIFIGRTDTEAEAPILWPPDVKSWLTGKDSDYGKDWRWEVKGMTGWAGWMASLTQRTWVWVNSWNWWWTGRPGVLQSMGSQRIGHDWATELNLLIQNNNAPLTLLDSNLWTWIWVDSGSWWWTGRPGVLQFMGLQRVGRDLLTEQQTFYDFHPIPGQ